MRGWGLDGEVWIRWSSGRDGGVDKMELWNRWSRGRMKAYSQYGR
jgi:hypothetical protein